MRAEPKYNFVKVFLAGALVATYAWLAISHFEKRRYGAWPSAGTVLDAYKCTADARVAVGQLCKCSECGMKTSPAVELR